MCILWPALFVFGILLMDTANPRDEEMAALSAAEISYVSTSATLYATQGTVDNKAAIAPVFAEDVVPGTTTRPVYLKANAVISMTENVGTNLGTVSIELVYKSQSFFLVSPPIPLTRTASKDVFCSPDYSSACGSRTCCSYESMKKKCRDSLLSSSSFEFIQNANVCNLDVMCGSCNYVEYVTSVCLVIDWTIEAGWKRSTKLSSCLYPFNAGTQSYAEGNSGAMVYLRSSDDPFIVLQKYSEGTMKLRETDEDQRNGGRGILLCGILVLVVLISLLVMLRVCFLNICDMDELREWLGLVPRSRAAEVSEAEAKLDPFFGGRSPSGRAPMASVNAEVDFFHDVDAPRLPTTPPPKSSLHDIL